MVLQKDLARDFSGCAEKRTVSTRLGSTILKNATAQKMISISELLGMKPALS